MTSKKLTSSDCKEHDDSPKQPGTEPPLRGLRSHSRASTGTSETELLSLNVETVPQQFFSSEERDLMKREEVSTDWNSLTARLDVYTCRIFRSCSPAAVRLTT